MSNNLIMPKQTASLEAFYFSLQLYYESYKRGEEWYSNNDYKSAIQILMPSLSYGAADGAYLVKHSEIVRYFGFAYYDYNAHPSRARITKSGIEMYQAYLKKNLKGQIDLLMESILSDSFGRNNTAIKNSDSDIDPPKLFIKASKDLNGLSVKDFAYILFLTNDKQISYNEACGELNNARSNISNLEIPIENANKYSDAKFVTFLLNRGLLVEKNNRRCLSDYIVNNYIESINNISIYNTEPQIIYTMNSDILEEIDLADNEDVLNQIFQSKAIAILPYDIDSDYFNIRNNRKPEFSPNSKGSSRFKTDPRITATAIKAADYKCEICNQHITFVSKAGYNYTEAHHLIPMAAQKNIKINIDRIENIVSLCPICHRGVHYGSKDVREEILNKLVSLRKEKLKKCGMDIKGDQLLEKYYK